MIKFWRRWGRWLAVLAILAGAGFLSTVKVSSPALQWSALTPTPRPEGPHSSPLPDLGKEKGGRGNEVRALPTPAITPTVGEAATLTPTGTGVPSDASTPIPTITRAPVLPTLTPTGDATPPAAAEGYPPATPTTTISNPPVSNPIPGSPIPNPPLSLLPFQPANGRPRIVVLDPGHGGSEVGAGIAGLAEKDVNLTIALKLRTLLEKEGLKVVLTRDSDRRVYVSPDGRLPAGYNATRADLQERIDIANRAGADVFISIHNNGAADPDQSGTEVWYDGKRPFAAFNQALAEAAQAALVEAIRGAGHPVVDRGIKEDSQFRVFQGRAYPIFVLGPPRTGTTNSRATQMPAILGETLFLSNPVEAELLKQDRILAAIAAGYRDGVLRYFRWIDEGKLTMPPGGWPPETPNYYELATPTPGRNP